LLIVSYSYPAWRAGLDPAGTVSFDTSGAAGDRGLSFGVEKGF